MTAPGGRPGRARGRGAGGRALGPRAGGHHGDGRVEASCAALGAGGADDGAPKGLAYVRPSDYAAFVRDPDGHDVELACHRPT
ncbi:MAG TPA: hypothetical protein VFS43_10195 [Polyangiaceae bacterium]|nr:hypothetical protein [Polyangiaceae bacterium]